jgi:hypothetical protein
VAVLEGSAAGSLRVSHGARPEQGVAVFVDDSGAKLRRARRGQRTVIALIGVFIGFVSICFLRGPDAPTAAISPEASVVAPAQVGPAVPVDVPVDVPLDR